MFLEVVVQLMDYFDLFFDDLVENTIFDGEKSSGHDSVLNLGLDAHPKRYS